MLTGPITDLPVRLTGGAVAIGGRPILRGIDLEVRAGEFLALMGANGSGKSTLVRALTGLRPLTMGSLELFGTPLGDFDDWRRIGFVPQRAGAGSGVPASVWEVVASGRLTHRRLLRPLTRPDKEAIDDAIRVVGLTDHTHSGVSQLSGGQQQPAIAGRRWRAHPSCSSSTSPRPASTCPISRHSPRRCGSSRRAAARSSWSPTSSARWRRWSTGPS